MSDIVNAATAELNQLPYLPTEIVLLIFESLAREDYKHALQLVLISRSVQAAYATSNLFIPKPQTKLGYRIDPILYSVIIIDSESRAIHLARTITTGSKPASFYSTRVDVFCSTLNSTPGLIAILSACTGISTLALWNDVAFDHSESLFHIIQSNSRLRRLSGGLPLIQSSLKCPPLSMSTSHLCYLTHLEVIVEAQWPSSWDALKLLHITYLSIYIHNSTDPSVHQFLSAFVSPLPDTTRACIAIFPQESFRVLPQNYMDECENADSRVVFGVDLNKEEELSPDLLFLRDRILILHGEDDFRKNWGRLPWGESDMWGNVEAILAKRNAPNGPPSEWSTGLTRRSLER